jgi:hypothetical protein
LDDNLAPSVWRRCQRNHSSAGSADNEYAAGAVLSEKVNDLLESVFANDANAFAIDPKFEFHFGELEI